MLWAVLPAIALAVLLVFTWRAVRAAPVSGSGATCRSSRLAVSDGSPALRIAAFVVACLHLVFGAIVRISGSGMGCGDHWPKCYGYWFPPLSRPDLIVEVIHRYLASILLLVAHRPARGGVAPAHAKPGVADPAACCASAAARRRARCSPRPSSAASR